MLLTAALTHIAQIPIDLAVAVDAATFQSKLLDQPGESLVFQLPPGVVATRMHIQESAEPANRAPIGNETGKSEFENTWTPW